MGSASRLPNSDSPDLYLGQPTPEEYIQIWTDTATSWKDSLAIPLYIAGAQYLATAPLAKDGGMTTWVLVEKNQPPNKRHVLCSCESFRRRSLTSDKDGNVDEGLTHGIASVFCPSELRRRGYATRHMKELAKVLQGGQSKYGKSIGSILYSDIGGQFYAGRGWLPHPENRHLVLPPAKMDKPAMAQLVPESELEALCLRDEVTIRKAMAAPSTARKRVVMLPDLDHMLWHIREEDFVTTLHFRAEAAGERHPDHDDDAQEHVRNVLHVLRLVVEGDDSANKPHEGQMPPLRDGYAEQGAALKAVLQAAQAEAADWRLDQVKLWEPSPLVKRLVEESGLEAPWVERREDGIACARWASEGGDGADEPPVWLNNEYYAWC